MGGGIVVEGIDPAAAVEDQAVLAGQGGDLPGGSDAGRLEVGEVADGPEGDAVDLDQGLGPAEPERTGTDDLVSLLREFRRDAVGAEGVGQGLAGYFRDGHDASASAVARTMMRSFTVAAGPVVHSPRQ